MPQFSVARARKFVTTALDAPLFEHVGQPLEDDDVIRAKTLTQYRNAMKSAAWHKVSSRTLNHHAARIIDVYGMDWFQKRNNKSVKLICEEVDKTTFKSRMNAAWKRLGLPEEIVPFIYPKTWTYNFISLIAYDYALGFGSDDSFKRRYIEPWLLAGHLPCGWKGRVPREPKTPPGVLPYAGVSLQEVVGDGKLVVF